MKKNIINLGPQHPAVHGVLRVITELNNETITKVIPEIGYLHRGTEKLSEYSEYYKIVPFFDRLDYTGLLLCEHTYVLCLEKLLHLNVDFQAQISRILFNELMRISSHFLALTTSAMDIGAVTPFLWLFEEREEIMNFFENISGARMHTALFRVSGLNYTISYQDLIYFNEIVLKLKSKIYEIYELLRNSNIWKIRFQNIGIIDKKIGKSYGVSGPVLRSLGFSSDQRLNKPYEIFQYIPINIIFGYQGDNLTRFFIRLEELLISLQYISYLINYLLNNYKNIQLKNFNKMRFEKAFNTTFYNSEENMESVIYSFKQFSEGYSLGLNKTYISTESPKGEFGVSIKSSYKLPNRPYRLKIRSPGYYNLNTLNIVSSNYVISDLLSYLSTLDLILGEIDK